MSSYIVTCVLLMITAVHAVPSFTRTYTSFQQLMPTYQIYWTVNETAQEIYLGFKVQTTGWIGFGLAEPSSGSMAGADIMTANVTNGRTVVSDRYATAFGFPPADAQCGDWVAVYGDESDGVTLVEVTRKLDTGDYVQDRVIPSGSVAVIFAHSSSDKDTLSNHGPLTRGTGFITFYGVSPRIADLQQDPTINISFPQITAYQIPPQQTTYICQSFELPMDQVRHMIAFETIVNSTNPAMVHHGLIHGCSANAPFFTKYRTPGECESPVGYADSGCSDVLFAWARGGDAFFLPPEAGFRASNWTNGGTFHILLQMHYDNPTLKTGAIDQSGFKIYMTNQLRPNDAGVMILGDPTTSSTPIPAGSTYTEYEYACSPTCTSRFTQPLQVFANFPHMHANGTRLWTTHWRNGTQLPDAIRTEYFSWTFQKNMAVNQTILPGDRLNTHCVYNSKNAKVDVTFGKNSTQEMCMDFISYWPKQDNFFVCGAQHRGNTNISICQNAAVLLPSGVPEMNNPSIFGLDPIDQRIRYFGNDISPPTNLTCPLVKDIYVPPPATPAPTNNGSTNTTNPSTVPPTNITNPSSSTGGSSPTLPIGVNTASSTATPLIMISFMISIMIATWN